MELVVIVIAVLLIRYLVRWWRNRPPSDRADDAPPTFRVVALGVAGTGKTVLLASLFNHLQHPRPGRSYRIDASGRDRADLGRLWTRLIDTEKDWPRATQRAETRTFDLDVVTSNKSVSHKVMRIRYLDFAGEVLAGEDDDGIDAADIEELEEHIAGAHALFGIIDGRRLVQYLAGEAKGISYMHGSIASMLAYMARGTAPIHFLVTKWDLVNDIGERSTSHEARLAIVRRALLDHPDIAGLLRSGPLQDRSIRLIPISAVGDDFARLDENGIVTKILGATPDPYHLDLPLAAVTQDYFAELDANLAPVDHRRITMATAARERIESTVKLLSAAAQSGLKLAFATSVPAALAAEPLLPVFFEWVSRPAIRGTDVDEDDLDDEELEELRLQSMRAGVLDDFEKALWEFESENPSSVLRPGRRR